MPNSKMWVIARAIELFWSRSDNHGMFYEIRRNERVVKSTDDVSYLDGQLISGSNYTYQVIAINPKGERSTAAVLVLNTQCGTFPTQSGVSVDLLDGPGGIVYSKRTAELFRIRPTPFGLTDEI